MKGSVHTHAHTHSLTRTRAHTQCEALVEKLCQRFRMTNTERQWRDVAFCLAQLSYTEKSFKKLMDKENFEVRVCVRVCVCSLLSSSLPKPSPPIFLFWFFVFPRDTRCTRGHM